MSPASPKKSSLPKGKADKSVPSVAPVAGRAPAHPEIELARELAAIVENHTLSELILETSGVTLTIRRGFAPAAQHHAQLHAPSAMPVALHHAPAPAALAPPPAAPAAPVDDKLHVVTSPFVGTYYRSPSPDADPYVVEGQKVDKGQVLCIVEAMKLMNEIEADIAGTIVSVLVDNGKTVEFGQPLFKITPA